MCPIINSESMQRCDAMQPELQLGIPHGASSALDRVEHGPDPLGRGPFRQGDGSYLSEWPVIPAAIRGHVRSAMWMSETCARNAWQTPTAPSRAAVPVIAEACVQCVADPASPRNMVDVTPAPCRGDPATPGAAPEPLPVALQNVRLNDPPRFAMFRPRGDGGALRTVREDHLG